MKTWLNKFSAPKEVVSDLISVDRRLRNAAPASEPPPFLHSRIMNAITAEQGRAPGSFGLPLRLRVAWRFGWALPVAALIGFLVFRALTDRQPPRNSQALSTVTYSLQIPDSLPDAIPASLSAPLSKELSGLDRDVANTSQYLLANLP